MTEFAKLPASVLHVLLGHHLHDPLDRLKCLRLGSDENRVLNHSLPLEI